MLLGFSNGHYLPVDILKLNPSGGAEINYSALFPYQASEAYLFMPSGYWPSVHDNTMYPSDFPTDILASMNDGEQTYVIKGTSTNGQYLMLFCINDIWYKTVYEIQNGKVLCFNEFTIEDEKPDAVIYMDSIQVKTYIDINPAHFSDLPTSFSVIKRDRVDLDTSAYIMAFDCNEISTEAFIWNKSHSDIPTSFMMYSVSDIYTSCYIREFGQATLNTEVHINAYGTNDLPTSFLLAAGDYNDLPTEVYVKARDTSDIKTSFAIKIDKEYRLPTEFVIKKYLDSAIPTELYVLVNATSDIPTSFIVKVWVDKKYIPVNFTLKRNDVNDIPTSVYIAGKTESLLDTSFSISSTHEYDMIPTEFILKKDDYSAINTMFSIIPCNYMETVITDALIKGINDIPTEFTVKYDMCSDMPTSCIVSFYNSMETIIRDTLIKGAVDLPTSLEIKYDCVEQIPTSFAVIPINTMESVITDALTKEVHDIPTSLEIKYDCTDDMPTSFAIMSGNTMEAIIYDYGIRGDSDIPTEIEIVYTDYAEMPTSFVLQAYNSMETKMRCGTPQYSDIPTSFFIYEAADIPTSFAVIPVNTMETTNRSYPPCKKVVFTDIIKDATGYSKTPSTNFGFISDIYVANKHNVKTGYLDTYNAVLGFDTSDTGIDRPYDSDYFKYNMIIKAELKLFINRKTTEDIVLDIHQIPYDSWDENKVAYKHIANMPKDKHVNTVTIPAGSYGYNKFDVTDAFDNWNDLNDKFSFLLTSDTIVDKNILSFSSHEGYYAPQLILYYYKFYPYADNSDLPTYVEIKPEDRLPTSFDLATPEEELLPTEFEIEEQTCTNDLTTELFIDGMTFEDADLPTEWEMIYYECEDKLPTSFEVNFTIVNETLPTEFEIERDYNLGCYVIII